MRNIEEIKKTSGMVIKKEGLDGFGTINNTYSR